MKKQRTLKDQIELYLQSPLWLTPVWVLIAVVVFQFHKISGICLGVFALVYLVVVFLIYHFQKPGILNRLINFAFEQNQVQKYLLKEMSMPYVYTDLQGHIVWFNQAFQDLFGKEKISKNNITQIFTELNQSVFPALGENKTIALRCEERHYQVEVKCMNNEHVFTQESVSESEPDGMLAWYFYDDTKIQKLERMCTDNKMVAGLIYIDNYDETMNSIEDIRRSLLEAMVHRKITKYMQSIHAICKNFERDKFLIIVQQRYVNQMQANKFSLLDEVREISIGNTLPVTLSIALGVNAEDYAESYENARAAMDLALGRGGDQAVVKNGDKVSYYGGKSQGVEKSTRVKARVKAHALREILELRDKVIIMGHRLPDADCFGAAVGLYRLAKSMNKKVHIILDELPSTIRPYVDEFIRDESYEDDMFVKSEEALAIMDANTILILADVCRESLLASVPVYKKADAIVLLDHHRQSSEALERVVLSYIEPYASSTCELVAEILQYINTKPKLRPVEADAMYSGIILDTDNFVTKTGVKTFEAAAYLRRSGADVVRVRKMFRGDAESAKYKARVIEESEIYRKQFAISAMHGDGLATPTVVGAQAANDLLDIGGVRASFVITEFKNRIYISARSIDDVNVQVMLEKLGGGGHINMAGAQLTEVTLEEAVLMIKGLIDEILEESET
ncbi:MAG: DHH family phosphoesterase [Lachnospiraceae bacterium]